MEKPTEHSVPHPAKMFTARRALKGLSSLIFGPEDARRRVMHEAVRIIANALGGYYIGDDYKLWIEDKQFIETFKQLSPHNYFSMERKYTLKQYAKSVSTVDGAVAECGSYVG